MNVAQHIHHCYKTGNKAELLRVKVLLINEVEELDIFFNEYLELFDEQLSTSNKDSKVWKAYNDKYKAYENIKHSLKMTDYYLGML